MAHNNYEHERLTSRSSIRVLDLLPSLNRRAPIRCNIRQIELGTPGSRYEAVSYVWGARQGSCPIACNNRSLLVTPNCLAALIQFRRLLRPRTLWIDAICIDQGTGAVATAERNWQVSLMGEVYRSATGVNVWLGSGNEDLTPQIFRYLKVLCFFQRLDAVNVPRIIRRAGKRVKPYVVKMTWPERPRGPVLSIWQSPGFTNLLKVLENEWFSRTWTMQEIITPGRCTVVCGSSTIDWSYFHVGMRIAGASHHSNANAQLLYVRDRIAAEVLDPTSIDDKYRGMHDVQLLKVMCKLQCSVLHDKVYGLYAIFRARGLHLPSPDYNKPLFQVLEEMARAYTQHKKKLDILRITLPPSKASGLPSWVPDWLSGVGAGQLTRSDITGTVIVCFDDFPSTVSACCGSFAYTTDDTSQITGKLIVRGKRVGSIQNISAGEYIGAQAVNEPIHFYDFVSTCREWCRIMWSAESYPTGEDPVQAGLRTVSSHRSFFPDGKPLDIKELLIWFGTLLGNEIIPKNGDSVPALTTGGRNLQGNAFESLENTRIAETIQGYVNYKANYAFFALSSGHFGSAYRTCQKGDCIYLLGGLDVPCVLRPCSDGFRFIALAYIYGAMKGQLWPVDENELQDVILI